MEVKSSNVYYQQGGGDEQYTPKYGVEVLLPYIQHLKDKIIRCPFDREDSNFVKILQENGFNIVYSHLDYGQDFFEYEPEQRDVIISNPPYTNKRKYRERCLDLKKPFALLLPLNILSDSIINTTMKSRERERESYNYLFQVRGGDSIIIKHDKFEINQHSKPVIFE